MRLFFLLLLWLPSTFLAAQKISFDAVAPIFKSKCAICHQPGQIGPMPLTDYNEISAFGAMISYVINERYMPPFLASNPPGELQDDRRLNKMEMELINQWIEQGLRPPQKKATDSMNAVKSGVVQFDTSYQIPDSFEHYGVYYDQFRAFIVPTGLKQDTFVSAISFNPGNSQIVRGATISVVTDTSSVSQWDRWDPGVGYFSFGEIGALPFESRWYTWHPLQRPIIYASNQGKFLPKNAYLIFHIHYGPADERLVDQSSLELKFTFGMENRRITQPLIHSSIMTKNLESLKQRSVHKVHAKIKFPAKARIYGLMPHGHFLAKSWEVFLKNSNGNSKMLLEIPNWDFKWKQMFNFTQPILIDEGDELHVLCEYDNTENNILNPSAPPADVLWGKRMFEEMFLTYVDYEWVKEEKKSEIDLFPSPGISSTDKYKISFQLNKPKNFSILLYDHTMKKVVTVKELQHWMVGMHDVTIDLSDQPKGTYSIRFESVKGHPIRSVMLVKPEASHFGVWKD